MEIEKANPGFEYFIDNKFVPKGEEISMEYGYEQYTKQDLNDLNLTNHLEREFPNVLVHKEVMNVAVSWVGGFKVEIGIPDGVEIIRSYPLEFDGDGNVVHELKDVWRRVFSSEIKEERYMTEFIYQSYNSQRTFHLLVDRVNNGAYITLKARIWK